MQTSDKNNVGRVFNIQRCSLHDGPGVRTTVFMKGCPLRCSWCQNPEGLSYDVSIAKDSRKCISCLSCENKLPQDGAALCPTGALTVFGTDYSPDKLVNELLIDRDFFGAKGGVTFSGGECLLQADFILECIKKLRIYGINIAIDTCGAVDYTEFEKLIQYTDLFLYDIKSIDAERHEKFTGMTNSRILENFERLYASVSRIWVRVPVINGFNADEKEISSIKRYLDCFSGVEKIEVLRYHELGVHKYELLGLSYTLTDSANVSDVNFEKIKSILNR